MDTVDKSKQSCHLKLWLSSSIFHTFPSILVLSALSLSSGKACAGSLTAQFSKACNTLKRMKSLNELQIFICPFKKKKWFQKHLYFLDIIFLHWKISAILLSILCCFIHHKWLNKGEESFTCVVNYRWPQTFLWSHNQYLSYICGVEDRISVFADDGSWVMWSFISFSIKSEMKPSHKTPTKDGSKQNHFTRKKN